MLAAVILVDLLKAYLAMGLLFAAVFLALGITRVDPAAKHSALGFKLIVLPGAAALWPVLLVRWIRKGGRA
jgi:hypothetical protein